MASSIQENADQHKTTGIPALRSVKLLFWTSDDVFTCVRYHHATAVAKPFYCFSGWRHRFLERWHLEFAASLSLEPFWPFLWWAGRSESRKEPFPGKGTRTKIYCSRKLMLENPRVHSVPPAIYKAPGPPGPHSPSTTRRKLNEGAHGYLQPVFRKR